MRCILWEAFALQYEERPAYLFSMFGSIIIIEMDLDM
jgi:hypothetical protein